MSYDWLHHGGTCCLVSRSSVHCIRRLRVIYRTYRRFHQKMPTSPSGRVYHSMLYDPSARCVLVFGGQTYYHWGMDLQDVWAYDFLAERWDNLGILKAGEVYAAAHDAKRQQAVMLNLKGETWAYGLKSHRWERKNPPIGPAVQYGHRMTFEAHTGRIVLFGGFKGESVNEGGFNNTWIYENEADRWTLMEPPVKPPARSYHCMVYHPVAERTIVWGGRPFQDQHDVMLWAYDSSINEWEALRSTNGPTRRYVYASMVYCPRSNRIIMFGGLELTGQFEGRLVGETWSFHLEGNRWTHIATDDGPPARSQHSMAYSKSLGEVVVFGGEINGAYAGGFTDELWLFDPIAEKWRRECP